MYHTGVKNAIFLSYHFLGLNLQIISVGLLTALVRRLNRLTFVLKFPIRSGE
jgi:hypothetical protein